MGQMTREDAERESKRLWDRGVKRSRQHGYMVGIIRWSTKATIAKGVSKESWEAAFEDATRRESGREKGER